MPSRLSRALGAVAAALFVALPPGSGVRAALPSSPATRARPSLAVEIGHEALTPFADMRSGRAVSLKRDAFDGFRWPVKDAINTPFGAGHDGIDIEGETGDPIRAAAPGKIAFAGDDGDGYGTKILIKHAHGFATLYAHLDEIKLSRGRVEQGDVIGTVGCTGSCSGDHLHFEIHKNGSAVDPVDFLP